MQRATLFTLLAGLLVLGACTGQSVKPAAQLPEYPRLPERTGEQADWELLDALLSSPITVELPTGIMARPPDDGIATHYLPNWVIPVSPPPAWRGGVGSVLTGPAGIGSFGFHVFATAADAEAIFLAVDTARQPPDYDSVTPTGFDAPVRCRAEPAPPVLLPGPGGVTACLVLSRNVLVVSWTRGAADPRRGNDELAVGLAQAALAHLQVIRTAGARTAAAPPLRHPVRVGLLTEFRWQFIPLARVFRERLTALGWVRGRDLAIEYRFADNQPERLPNLAAELVQERVDVIVTLDLPSAQAAKAAIAGAGIPLVFMLWDGADALKSGLVPSLARPGAHITGIAWPENTGLAAKRLDLLAEALPTITRVGVLIKATDGPLWQELEDVARARHVELLPQVVRAPADVLGAVATMKAAGAQILLQADDTTNYAATSPLITQAAQQHGLPVVFNLYNLGGILNYVLSGRTMLTRTAEYVDLVLRGTPPAHLPVELVSDYELTVNLVRAQTLGLTVAPSVLARATEIQEPGAAWPRRVR